jgi:beta-glucosidase
MAAALAAFRAGIDMEMDSALFRKHLKRLVAVGKVRPLEINKAVKRILQIKYDKGLFTSAIRDQVITVSYENHRKLARDVARRSMVLLQNRENVLPFKRTQRIALNGRLGEVGRPF